MLKFVAPEGKHFMSDNSHALMDGEANHPFAVLYKWTKVTNIVDPLRLPSETLLNLSTGIA